MGKKSDSEIVPAAGDGDGVGGAALTVCRGVAVLGAVALCAVAHPASSAAVTLAARKARSASQAALLSPFTGAYLSVSAGPGSPETGKEHNTCRTRPCYDRYAARRQLTRGVGRARWAGRLPVAAGMLTGWR